MRTDHHSTDAEDGWFGNGGDLKCTRIRVDTISPSPESTAIVAIQFHITVTYRRKNFKDEMREDLVRRFAKALHIGCEGWVRRVLG